MSWRLGSTSPTTAATDSVISSTMIFGGLSVDACKAIEPAIKAGLAETTGVDPSVVNILGYTEARRLDPQKLRRLGVSTSVEFEILVSSEDDVMDAETVLRFLEDSATDSSYLLSKISSQVTELDLEQVLSDAGGDMDAVSISVEAPIADFATDTPEEAPSPSPQAESTPAPPPAGAAVKAAFQLDGLPEAACRAIEEAIIATLAEASQMVGRLF